MPAAFGLRARKNALGGIAPPILDGIPAGIPAGWLGLPCRACQPFKSC